MRRERGAKIARNPATTRLLESGRQMHTVIRTSSSRFVLDVVATKLSFLSASYTLTSLFVLA